ncbi:RNA polymerase sigma-70 factor [Mucilaginibacter sp. KACC 22773]|uniref:RNA polymerase sigma factor n=1 Tax=Mucilaginibacter sp. KACC 22773 TaxID=3025671 RepID=UPI0023671CA6|nr:RNA polymerase sigma-70 factor [Mucilaginibacter sp. KACC 22773]WDF78961.1 RNA polymerase sigma-70 factor [Mucilaginibacter sp. KACC 22773]
MGTYSGLSDNELINLIKESDHSAYNEIYHRYFYLIYTHAYKKLRDEEQAKDIVQDIFATIWFKRESDLPKANLAGYLFTAVRNRIFDLFAHEHVKTKHIDSLKDYLNGNAGAPTDHRVRENDMKAHIEKEIRALPLKMRQIFEMSRKANLSYKEIAERLNVSENNVSKQVNNALRVLKTKLNLIIFILFLLKLYFR